MDYLLRDSLHAGVRYGYFDLERVVNTVQAVPYESGIRLGVGDGGVHAAEGLILARYFMFTQVYFHKTRVAYDLHLRGALREMLPGGQFPTPVEGHLDQFLDWDDWKVLGVLKDGAGGEHGARLISRKHFREIWKTPETAGPADFKQLADMKSKLAPIEYFEESSAKSWYKPEQGDIPVIRDLIKAEIQPLSRISGVLSGIKPVIQTRLFVRPEVRDEAIAKLRNGSEVSS